MCSSDLEEYCVATLADLAEVMNLVREAVHFMHANGNFQWDEDYPQQQKFITDIESESLYLLRISDKLAGFVSLNADQSPTYKTINWETPEKALCIHRMVVSNSYKGLGLARKMFLFSEKIAKEKGYQAIRSDTNEANKPMNHLFLSLGYTYRGKIQLRQNPVLFNCYDKIV